MEQTRPFFYKGLISFVKKVGNGNEIPAVKRDKKRRDAEFSAKLLILPKNRNDGAKFMRLADEAEKAVRRAGSTHRCRGGRGRTYRRPGAQPGRRLPEAHAEMQAPGAASTVEANTCRMDVSSARGCVLNPESGNLVPDRYGSCPEMQVPIGAVVNGPDVSSAGGYGLVETLSRMYALCMHPILPGRALHHVCGGDCVEPGVGQVVWRRRSEAWLSPLFPDGCFRPERR